MRVKAIVQSRLVFIIFLPVHAFALRNNMYDCYILYTSDSGHALFQIGASFKKHAVQIYRVYVLAVCKTMC